jgi:hypothetical protein
MPRSLVALLATTIGLAACPGFGERPIESAVDSQAPLCTQVQQVLESRCNQCHSVPAAQGAPSYLRLDVFETVDGVLGAQHQAERIVARSADRSMPPSGVMLDREIAVLEAWLASGADITACSGAGPTPEADAGMDADADGGDAAEDAALEEVREVAATLEDVTAVFERTCAPHHYGASATIIDLTADDTLLERLLAPSTQSPGQALVVPGNPDASYLYLKIIGEHLASGGTGDRMPIGRPLSADDTDTVRRWILGLAD